MESINKQYTVIISETAANMLIHHTEVSPKAADKLRKEIMDAAVSLKNLPERNSWLSNPLLTKHKYRKLVINKRYLLIYQIRDEIVYVDYILDCPQDYHWLLKPESGL